MIYVVIIISVLIICATVITVKALDVIAERPELLNMLKKNKLHSKVASSCNIINNRKTSKSFKGSDFDIDK